MTFMIFVTFISIHFVIICVVLLWRTYEMYPTLSLKYGCDSSRLPITRGSPGPIVPSGSATPGADGYKKTLGRQGLSFSGVAVPSGERAAVAVSSGVRAAAIPGASGCGTPRRATDGDAPMADGQAPTALLNRTSGGDGYFLERASDGNPGG
jgi:hypothetical protein